LQSQFDVFGNATSLLLHSAWLRVVVDIGVIGLVIVAFAIVSLFDGLPVYMIALIAGPIFAAGFSVGSFFNPLGSFILFLGLYLVSCLPIFPVGGLSELEVLADAR